MADRSKRIEGAATPTKLPYKAPKLVQFGTLRAMTLTFGNMGTDDGGLTTGLMKTAA